VRVGMGGDVFRGAGTYYSAVAALGAEVEHPVGGLDDID
jgi:hypothetical protein